VLLSLLKHVGGSADLWWLAGIAAGAFARFSGHSGRLDNWSEVPGISHFTRRSAAPALLPAAGMHEPAGKSTVAAPSTPPGRLLTPIPAIRMTPGEAGDGGVPARRAMVRWGWRLFRREWRQQLLVLSLIAISVAATVLGAGVATDSPTSPNADFGTASNLVMLSGSDPHLAADLATIKAHFGTLDTIENENLVTGLVQGAQLRAQDSSGAYGRPMLALLSGHYPRGAAQVAMTQQLESIFGLRVGGVWDEAGRALRVVGIVENPQNLLDNFALVAPGQLRSPHQVTVLFDATSRSLSGFHFPGGATPESPVLPNGINPAIIVFVVAVFGLIFVGLVAAAGFAVLAQRRLRSLGMLEAIGATDRNVRLVMTANGAAVGIVATMLGGLVGLGAWIAYVPHFSASVDHRVVWTELPWWLVATAMALAVVTATLAALRPTRAIARIPIVAALSGRPAPPKAVHRTALPGVALLALGAYLLATSGGWGGGSTSDNVHQLGGLLSCSVGLLLLGPVAIALLGTLGGNAPVGIRVAMRDLSRYRSRSGSALAATSFAVLIAMLVALLASGRYANVFDYFGPNLPSNELAVYTPGNAPGDGGPVKVKDLTSLHRRATAIADRLGASDELALYATNAGLIRHTLLRNYFASGTVYIATPALLRHYGISPRAISPGTLLITSRPGLAGLSGLRMLYGDFQSRNGIVHNISNPNIQQISKLPPDVDDPNLLVTMYAVRELKLHVVQAGWLIQTPHPLTALQVEIARRDAVAARLTVETKNDDPSLATVRNDATAAGILLALGVLAMTVGLIRTETAGDLRTLTATGAKSRTRRTLTGATAGALGLLGAVLGTGVAFLAAAAFFWAELGQLMSQMPVFDLVLILVGLPVTGAAGGWIFAGREPPAIARQPLE
jgi:putative ABC transport system permease protein